MNPERPAKCRCDTEGREVHRKGCRPGRPLCRWMRRRNPKQALCNCQHVHYPHRAGWCASFGEVIPLAIRNSPSWRKAS
jgi:hypothetical protein